MAAGDEATADLAAALDAEPAARTRFDVLSHSMQRRWVFPVEDAKTDATRQRRIATMVQTLAGEAAVTVRSNPTSGRGCLGYGP